MFLSFFFSSSETNMYVSCNYLIFFSKKEQLRISVCLNQTLQKLSIRSLPCSLFLSLFDLISSVSLFRPLKDSNQALNIHSLFWNFNLNSNKSRRNQPKKTSPQRNFQTKLWQRNRNSFDIFHHSFFPFFDHMPFKRSMSLVAFDLLKMIPLMFKEIFIILFNSNAVYLSIFSISP